MAVTFTQIEQTATAADMPTNAAVTYTTGINAPGGPVEFLIIRGDLTFAADPTSTDITSLLSSIRVVLNGEVVHDFRAGFSGNGVANITAGTYGYFLNSIGGRAYEVPTAGGTTREFYWGIPIGRQTASGVNRYEIVMTWAAAAGALGANPNLSFWLRMNDGMQTTTTVCPSTSFTHAIALEQVIVRVPQNVPGVVSGILVQNDSAADELGAQGIRINPMGDYGLEPQFWRWMNDDLANGIMAGDVGGAGGVLAQTYFYETPGALFVPTFGLVGGDIALQVDSTAATTRTYTPVITNPVGAKAGKEVRQTQRAVGNTAKSIVAFTEN